MINNRQNGRRRGRGGGGGGGGGNGQRQGGQGRGDSGNRIDSRARGNAAQLLEKYKNLASDAQRQGDRVTTEYYLQFADHYFRVLADQRGRFEDQQQRRQPRDDFDLDGDDDYGDEGEPIRAGEQQGDGEMPVPQQQQHGQRRDRDRDDNRGNRWDNNREARQDRGDRPRREPREDRQEVAGQHRSDPPAQDESLNERAETVLEADAPAAPRRRGRPRRDAAPVEPQGEAQGEANGVDADRLPPSLGLATPANDADGDEPKPRRRRTRAAPAEVPTAAE